MPYHMERRRFLQNFFETLLTRRTTSSGRSGVGWEIISLFEPRINTEGQGWEGEVEQLGHISHDHQRLNQLF